MRLQHYGFPFNYRTLMLDYNKPTPPLPASCVSLTERFAATYRDILHDPTRYARNAAAGEAAAAVAGEAVIENTSGDAGTNSVDNSTTATNTVASEVLPINQLTINEYLPGQGIAPHTGVYTVNLYVY